MTRAKGKHSTKKRTCECADAGCPDHLGQSVCSKQARGATHSNCSGPVETTRQADQTGSGSVDDDADAKAARPEILKIGGFRKFSIARIIHPQRRKDLL